MPKIYASSEETCQQHSIYFAQTNQRRSAARGLQNLRDKFDIQLKVAADSKSITSLGSLNKNTVGFLTRNLSAIKS